MKFKPKDHACIARQGTGIRTGSRVEVLEVDPQSDAPYLVRSLMTGNEAWLSEDDLEVD